MQLYEQIKRIENQVDFVNFVNVLIQVYEKNPEEWGQNRDIPSYLQAITGAVAGVEGLYTNQDQPFPDQRNWRFFAVLLWMAGDYE